MIDKLVFYLVFVDENNFVWVRIGFCYWVFVSEGDENWIKINCKLINVYLSIYVFCVSSIFIEYVFEIMWNV